MSSSANASDNVTPWGSVVPAPRFLIEQSWWLCSELVRRHPDHVVYEMHPGGGSSDVLMVRPARELADGDAKIMINRGGTVRVQFHRYDNSLDEIDVSHSSAALAAQSPHEVVKALESTARLPMPAKAPASTPRSLAFRLASVTLTALLNDRRTWDWRQVFHDTSGYSSGVLPYLKNFPDAQAGARGVRLEPWDWGVPEAHYWALLRDGKPVAVLSTEGVLHRRTSTVELAQAYVSSGRDIHRMTSELITSKVR